ncbi:MAG: bacillithiol biosynthesis cysteine-adding enzyme BshC [Melioribacteraceae bacterium]|nr:bacillithiol biosynthesis cysteine-adding enzyme BshC [Melioribacteraceae bacterium]
MYIKYSDLPGFRRLFLDYLYDFDKVKNFYNQNYRDTENYESKFSEIVQKERLHRFILADIISGQYSDIKKSKLVEANIELLKSPKTLTVVTGQQLSIFGGPLYTFYKIITAIKLSRQLKEKYDTYNFVPVFWLEGDDHDFHEVKSVTILDKTNELKNFVYDDGLEDDLNRGSIGKLQFNDNITTTKKEYFDGLRDSEFKEEIVNLVDDAYQPGKSFVNAFKKILNKYFGEYGLVVINPQSDNIKKLLRPVFKREIEYFREHSDFVIERSAELEDLYHAQVKVKPINIFIHEPDGRYLLEPEEENFKLKNKRKKITQEELLKRLEEAPQDFSPNVLLRPICQDYLLPTAFYIGGPSEIAYFAQVIPNYSYFDIPQPYIYPRASATILEKNISGLIERFELNLIDLLGENDRIKTEVLSSISDENVDKLFSEIKNEIQYAIEKLKENIFSIDQSLLETAGKTEERINHSLDVLKSKVEKAVERKHETVLRQIDKISANIYPGNEYQERVINFTSFAVKYGADLIKVLINELSINKFEHQIIEL